MLPKTSAHRRARYGLLLSVLIALAACGGGGTNAAGPDGSPSSNPPPTVPGSPDAGAPTSAAAAAATRLGRASRMMVGLGLGGASESSIQSQGLHPDIYDAYLVNAGAGDWTTWNSPAGSYVNLHANRADRMGAVPMFTLYQMASNGDGNLSGLTGPAFMSRYWANVRLMFQRIAVFGKPALVTVEPDFWGYVERQAPGSDPRQLSALVTIDGDCEGQPNSAAGVAGCILQMAHKYAPKALVGFSPSAWGGNSPADVSAFMQAAGLHHGDFLAMQTLDRDAGCFEAKATSCVRAGSGWYWDDAAFAAHLALARAWHESTGLPLIWWQTPMGVPSPLPGGTSAHWRDNRAVYFLTRARDVVAAGGLGVVFSAGATGQTTIDTDAGQYKRLSEAYLAGPAPLP